MKKLITMILASMITITIVGCGPGASSTNCFREVVKKYKNADVSPTKSSGYRFLVRKKNGEVLIVFCGEYSTAGVTEEDIIFEALK